MDIEQRLVADASDFREETNSLDEEGFISRTLAAIHGIILPDIANTEKD